MTAIVLIDLQREFFDPDGVLKERYIPPVPILSSIQYLVQYGRSNNYPIIWIRAEYSPTIEEGRKGSGATHTGRPCCVKGSILAEFHSDLPIAAGDLILTKHYYSGFVGTVLKTHLRSQNITHLILGGVTLKNCVMATLRDAVQLGFTATIVPECTAMSNMEDFEDKLQECQAFATITDLATLTHPLQPPF